MHPNLSTASDGSQADNSNKRIRTHPERAEVPATAAQRFFNTPELVQSILVCLAKERIDVLALSLVSKALRVQALNVWVRQLDVPVKAANDRLKFFRSNPTLLQNVRYLRLRHDSGTLPLIDLSIYDSDPLCLPDMLSQRLVALKIRHREACDYLAESSPSERRSDSDQLTGIQDSVSRMTLAKLAEVILKAKGGPGLRSFQFHASSSEADLPPAKVDPLWQQVVQHAPSLLYLNIHTIPLELPSVVSKTAFARLEELQLQLWYSGRVPLIEDLLDDATNLHALAIRTDVQETFSLRQTFPRLRYVDVEGVLPGKDEVESFARRHPNVVSFWGDFLPRSETVSEPASPSTRSIPKFYPNLAHIRIQRAAELQRHLDSGRSFAVIDILSAGDNVERCLTLLPSYPAAAERLTFLALSFGPVQITGSFLSQVPSMVHSQALPNLAELHLSIPEDWQEAFGWACNFEAGTGRLVAAMIKAQSLEVLRLSGPNQVTQHREILLDNDFPPALEYFSLRRASPVYHEPQYFRFVSSHPEAHIVTTGSGGKRGRLQRVPSVFRQRITKEGVWHRPLVKMYIDTVLDHLDDAPI
ncbi:hypothetical protein OC846_006810 [Tilletia horrida]|uniref:Uncharacterized protein n=1 Tax=Tilletia horrida TaxID=155126 RepID=A0AAN6JNC5_9BASI|nr:hypothetical protein OC846_006810 [Tilletia horrida]